MLKVEKEKLQKKLVLNIAIAKGRGRESGSVCERENFTPLIVVYTIIGR
jgi:hypothetical protein